MNLYKSLILTMFCFLKLSVCKTDGDSNLQLNLGDEIHKILPLINNLEPVKNDEERQIFFDDPNSTHSNIAITTASAPIISGETLTITSVTTLRPENVTTITNVPDITTTDRPFEIPLWAIIVAGIVGVLLLIILAVGLFFLIVYCRGRCRDRAIRERRKQTEGSRYNDSSV